ncbi:nuclease SbcCD subunit C-like [Penaeus monodon]|uniref:nuclease SbcCD subunit C-like n=1 Tax=Penaeus monodon TaxID=6687 RepID=UPI0018A73FDE|nr:nuclease SbcCD subunit C-like [Penaeus monodon]
MKKAEAERTKDAIPTADMNQIFTTLKDQYEEAIRCLNRKYNSDGSEAQNLEKKNRDLKENIRSLKEQHKADFEAWKKAEAEKMKDAIASLQDQLAQEKHKAQQQKAMEMAMETEREKFEMDIRFMRDELKILEDKCKKEKQDEDKNYGSDESDTQRLAKESRDLKENISSLQETTQSGLKSLEESRG